MNHTKTLINIPWYLSMNHSTVPNCDLLNELSEQKSVFTTFAYNFDRIVEMLKFGVEQKYISNRRIQEVIKVDTKSVEGMETIADVLNNDFWNGFSCAVTDMNDDIAKRYNSVMPAPLKERFNEAVSSHLGYQSLKLGKHEGITYNSDFMGITISINDIYLTSFDLSKYRFNNRLASAFTTLTYKTMMHQIEAPVCFGTSDEWLIEEYLDGKESEIQSIYAYWLENNENNELDVEAMISELKLEGLDEFFDVGDISSIVQHVEIKKAQEEYKKLSSKKAWKSSMRQLKEEAKVDPYLASLVKMIEYLPSEQFHNATESQGDLCASDMALYGFNTPTEMNVVETAFDRAWQSGELAVLSLDASKDGLMFLQNFFETLYLKSFIQVFLEYGQDEEILSINNML
ncbi:hypothetical protein [Shewanella sp. UCD-KL12]|uniref:hypothetical protein n=1 Tax=Shewanella sp. UCD-KL12 TaxID=1917163 RepID=UPI000970DC2A|nr:hypothetical protein [Shewanella sp. UCD-KL12]